MTNLRKIPVEDNSAQCSKDDEKKIEFIPYRLLSCRLGHGDLQFRFNERLEILGKSEADPTQTL